MLRKMLPACLGLALALLAALLNPSRSAWSARFFQAGMPEHGWTVCVVGGMEMIPDVGSRQVFELCNGDSWRVRAYCLQPGVPNPPQGALCSLTNGDNFFCGAGVQSLALYGMLQTPAATETPTITATASETATASSTATATATATATSTITLTPEATGTATVTATGLDTLTPTASTTSTAVRTQTPYDRPRAGGPGNAGYFLAVLLGLGLTASLGVFALLRRRA